MEKFNRFLKEHLFRVASSLIITAGFTVGIIYTEKWIFIWLECMGYALLAGIVIAIDAAIQYPDDFNEPKR